MKKAFLILCLLIIAVKVIAHDEQRNRDFYFSVGIGLAMISYGEEMDSTLDTYGEQPEVDRNSINVDITIGKAVCSRLFLVGNVNGYGDIFTTFYDERYTLSYITVLTALGVRFYPFTSGLLLGVDFGSAKMIVTETGYVNYESGSGSGYNLMIAYDFDKTSTGLGLIVGAKAGKYTIEDLTVTSISLSCHFVYK